MTPTDLAEEPTLIRPVGSLSHADPSQMMPRQRPETPAVVTLDSSNMKHELSDRAAYFMEMMQLAAAVNL